MELVNFINKYKNKILNVNIAIIILSLIFANHIYKRQTAILESLRENKDAEIKKNEVLNNIGQLEKKINAYKNYLAKKDTSLIISKINSIAKDCDVRIVSFKPQTEKNYPVYIKYPFFLIITVRDYHRIGEFISKIESSPDIYMVDSVSIKSVSLEKERKETTDKITVELILSNILFKG